MAETRSARACRSPVRSARRSYDGARGPARSRDRAGDDHHVDLAAGPEPGVVPELRDEGLRVRCLHPQAQGAERLVAREDRLGDRGEPVRGRWLGRGDHVDEGALDVTPAVADATDRPAAGGQVDHPVGPVGGLPDVEAHAVTELPPEVAVADPVHLDGQGSGQRRREARVVVPGTQVRGQPRQPGPDHGLQQVGHRSAYSTPGATQSAASGASRNVVTTGTSRRGPCRRSAWCREHRELRGRHADEVAVDVAPAQLQEPTAWSSGTMSQSPTVIRVGAAMPRISLVRPAVGARDEVADLVEQILELVRVRRLRAVVLLHGRAGDHVDGHRAHRAAFSGRMPSGLYEIEPTTTLRTSSGCRTARCSATAPPTLKPKTSTCGDTQVPQQPDDVGGQAGGRQRAVDVVGAAVRLEVGGDHLAPRGQPGEDVAELQVDVEQPPVQQEQWRARPAVDLVVHLPGRSPARSRSRLAVVVGSVTVSSWGGTWSRVAGRGADTDSGTSVPGGTSGDAAASPAAVRSGRMPAQTSTGSSSSGSTSGGPAAIFTLALASETRSTVVAASSFAVLGRTSSMRPGNRCSDSTSSAVVLLLVRDELGDAVHDGGAVAHRGVERGAGVHQPVEVRDLHAHRVPRQRSAAVPIPSTRAAATCPRRVRRRTGAPAGGRRGPPRRGRSGPRRAPRGEPRDR